MKSLDDGTLEVVLKSHKFQATAGSGHEHAEVRYSGGIYVPLVWEFIDVCVWMYVFGMKVG